ncbi:MAG: hypothetical protein NTY55_00995 [Flavobacteriia bacterium]|jgi:hypothetical protein|nr:hypothetical protein [Flavobacteriia bacterium]
MDQLNLNSNITYSTFNLTLDYEGIGYVHNNALYNFFQLMNKIGEDKTIKRLKDLAIEETKMGENAGVYPEGSTEVISELYTIFELNENDQEKLLNEVSLFYDKILTDKKFNETLILGTANLAVHSVIFWSNFDKDNPLLRGRGRTAFIAGIDLLGAITTGWNGSKAGASVGAVFGNPLAGILVGGIGGFLLGGAVASGGAYYASR